MSIQWMVHGDRNRVSGFGRSIPIQYARGSRSSFGTGHKESHDSLERQGNGGIECSCPTQLPG